MSDARFVVIFSHSPQIRWFSLIARVLRVRFGITSTLWVIGENDRLEGERLGEFGSVVNLIDDESVFSRFESIPEASAYLRSFEDNVGEFCVSRDIAMDRYIKGARWPINKALTYSAGILSRMRSEIDRSGLPVFAIGEENCLHYRFARRVISAPYFCTYMVGHWGERIFFEYTMNYQWESCQKQYRNYLKNGIPAELKTVAEKRLDDLVSDRRQPTAMVRFIDKGGNSILRRMSPTRLIVALERTWANVVSMKEEWNPKYASVFSSNVLVSATDLLKEANRKRKFKNMSRKQVPTDIEFAGFFLHMQPEHTVEGVAFEYRDQAATALNIAAALPAGMILLVKEHSPMVGKRPSSFYEKLGECPNIRILDDTINSYDVVNNSRLMFTLSGSVALESMYIGKPVIVLGKIYHTVFRGIYPAGDIRNLAILVAEILNGTKPGASRGEAIMALAAMYSSSYPGRISSQFNLEEMGANENLDAIASAFEKELSLQPKIRI